MTKAWRCRGVGLGVCLIWIWGGPGLLKGETTTTSGEYVVSTWRIADGLPSDRIRNIVQTRSGYLWLATANGLVRFDGVSFRVFDIRTTPGMPDNLVNRLFEDQRGRLWIGHSTGRISRLEASGLTTVAMPAAWLGVPVERFAELADGSIWALNRNGVICEVGETEGGALYQRAGRSRAVDLVTDQAGIVWVADGESVEPWAPALPTGGRIAGPDEVLSLPRIVAAREGGIWVFEEQRARRWDADGWRESRHSDLAPIGATTLLETQGGDLVRGTFRSGLEILTRETGTRYVTAEGGLHSDWIRCVWEDREGSLWVGAGSAGLSRLRPRHVKMLAPPERWRDRGALSVAPARDGGLWLGIEGPGLFRYDEVWGARLHATDELDRMVAHAVREDRWGRVWVGATGTSVRLWTGDDLVEVAPGEGLNRTNALWEAQDGAMWLGTINGPARWKDGELTWPLRGLAPDFGDVRCFSEDGEGGIWLGSMGGGLARYHQGRLQRWGVEEGLASDSVWTLLVADSGEVWVGTYGRGLSRWKDGRIQTISTEQGLPSDVICAIVPDDAGSFWISSDVGIFRVAEQLLNACADGIVDEISGVVLDESDGLGTTDMTGGGQPVACRTAKGELWFASAAGFARVNPREVREAHAPPSVGIENIRVDGRVVREVTLAALRKDDRTWEIPAGAGSVEIDYTAFNLVSSKRIQFRYQMIGLDATWVETAGRRTAFFSHVPPGRYRFRVGAAYDGTNWSSAVAEVDLFFAPQWWQTWWLRGGAGLMLMMTAGGGIYLMLRRRHRREVAGLRQAQSIERERTRIAHDIHDDLGAGLTQINLLTASARRLAGDSEALRRKIEQIESSAQDMTRAMDEIVWAVNPGNDTLDSLASYLGMFARDYLSAAHVRCELGLPIQLPSWPVSSEVRHGMYLCLKEALNNVVKHAGASRVSFRVVPAETHVSFELADDGKGLRGRSTMALSDPGNGRIASGVGFTGMQRRMSNLGGRMEWTEPETGGTTIRFLLPGGTKSATPASSL